MMFFKYVYVIKINDYVIFAHFLGYITGSGEKKTSIDMEKKFRLLS